MSDDFDDIPETHLDDDDYDDYLAREFDDEGGLRGEPRVKQFIVMLVVLLGLAMLLLFF